MVLNNSGKDETPSETARSFDSSDRFAETPNSLSNSDRLAEKISSLNSSEKVAETVHSLSGSELQYPTVTIINSETGEKTVVVKDWTDEEERRLVRRVDFILIPLLFWAFFILQIDRGNISNVYTDINFYNMLELNNTKINIASALFAIGIVSFEIPFNVALQRLSPSVFLSFQILTWSLIATLQCRITNIHSFYATRFLLGAAEAGFIPGGLYYISTWYKKSELGLRHTLYFFGNLTALSVSGLIAAGILKDLPGVGGLYGWQWIFLIEGVIGVGYAIIFFFLLPELTEHPAAFWNRKWLYFDARERSILRRRVIFDDPSKVVSTRRTNLKDVWSTFRNPVPWFHVLISMSSLQTGTALSSYIPLIIRSMGFSVFEANARSSIPRWCTMALLLILTLTSKYFKPRAASILFAFVWKLSSQIAVRELPDTATPTQRFTALCFLVTVNIVGHVLNSAWLSMNIRSPRERSVALAMLIMAANIGGVCGGQILRDNDKPLYKKGFLALIIVDVFSILVLIATFSYYFYKNRKADKLYGKVEPINTKADDSPESLDRGVVYVGFGLKNTAEEEADAHRDKFNLSFKEKYVYIKLYFSLIH
ncbi:hypothetical protein LJB42_001114 [Komagataella kurtzmanii]|nr:hypothetical protein LJB42_001114 [Komagataella kurtzmanii]